MCGICVTHCNILQHTTTHCNTLQHTATHADKRLAEEAADFYRRTFDVRRICDTLQKHTATHLNTLQRTSTHCNTLFYPATHTDKRLAEEAAEFCRRTSDVRYNCDTLQHTAMHCNTLQHTATHCNTHQQITR